jgi:hypothetical protein
LVQVSALQVSGVNDLAQGDRGARQFPADGSPPITEELRLSTAPGKVETLC